MAIVAAFAWWGSNVAIDGSADGETLFSRWFSPSSTVAIHNNTDRSLTWDCGTGGFSGLAPGKTADLRFLKHDDGYPSEGCSTDGIFGSELCIEPGLVHVGQSFDASAFVQKFECP